MKTKDTRSTFFAFVAALVMMLAASMVMGCKPNVSTGTQTFKVSFSAGDNGTLKAMVDNKEITSGSPVEKGKTVVFTAVPAAGYRVKQWTGTDNPASTDKTAVLTVKEKATVSVEFEAIGQLFNVTFDTPQNGTLKASLDGAPFTGGKVQEGKIIVFTAEPAPTYRVRKWTGLENADTKTILTLTVTKAVHVSVEFINVPEYTITFSQPANGILKATLDGVQFNSGDKAAEGQHIVFTAIPETGYRLLKWENVNTDPEHGYVKVHTVQADKTVSITFEPDDILTIRKDWHGEHYVESCKKTAEGVIEVPDYVKSIASNAFKDCVKVTEVKLPSGLTEIGSEAFRGCTGLTSITIPAGVTQIGYSAFEGCTGLTSINLPEGVTQIESSTFYGCTGLTSISLPEGVTKIGGWAFSGCTGLTSISLPAGVTKIEEYTFSGCTGLTSITIPADVTKIENSTFYGCTGLTSISLPAGVTKIGSEAFRGCTGLTSITIPAGVTKIENSTFYGCTGLKDITIDAMNITEIGSFAFWSISAEAKFKVKSGSNVKQKLIDYGIAADKIIEQP
ncbi:MAG: leucine-rich repeat protein [Treponema sp.]